MSPVAFASPVVLGASSAFSPSSALSPRRPLPSDRKISSRRANISMTSEENIAVKARKIASVTEKLADCEMVFSAPLEGLSVADVYTLKEALPPTSSVATVKNTLMRRAIADSEWEILGDLTKNSSMWFFVQEDIKGTVEAYKKFAKDLKRDGIIGGALEGVQYDQDSINAIAALPTKKELITKIAVLLKMVPTKVGRAVNAVPTKVARAVKLAVADEPSEAPAAE